MTTLMASCMEYAKKNQRHDAIIDFNVHAPYFRVPKYLKQYFQLSNEPFFLDPMSPIIDTNDSNIMIPYRLLWFFVLL